MKTDGFDEEFRRKLLGLPAEADPDEVERIQQYVQANKPALPGLGWGKLLLYGGSGLLLIGSLSYNLLQNYRNTRLHSSLDSLTRQSVGSSTPAPVIRHDTIYITQSGDLKETSVSLPTNVPGTGWNQRQKQNDPTVPAGAQRTQPVAMGRTELPQPGYETAPSEPNGAFSLSKKKTNTPATTNPLTPPNRRLEQSGQQRIQPLKSVAALSTVSPERSTDEIVGEEPVTKPASNGAMADGVSLNDNVPTALRSGKPRSRVRQPTRPSESNKNQSAMNYATKQEQRTVHTPSPAGFAPVNSENTVLTETISEASRQRITAEPVASRQLIVPSMPLAGVPNRSFVASKTVLSARPAHRSWHLTLPNLSVPNAQYRLGGGLTTGNNAQFGGAVLGEIQLNPHWSVQTGLRVGYAEGFHYHDEQDFNEHQREDFRQTYASQVPLSSDIQNIKQVSSLLQVPLQIAYYYPIGRQWGLRLGLGTDLDLWVRSAINYDYRESSRPSEQGSVKIKEHFHVLNNITLNPAAERSWKNWHFRAGPFISPQIRPVGYKPNDLSWGANLQIMHKLGK